ncbi:MAG: nitronate monooxygenase [Phycisphaerae bacterium]|nr:nitronate monooxygenase [Phycisphaerae bacterium]
MPVLKIGDLNIHPPVIQGGMGVGVSKSNLASAVANEGAVGVIASVGLGELGDYSRANYSDVNKEALRKEIQKTRSRTKGIIGVNIMCALSDYESLVETAVEEKADIIISGAGLPFNLPLHTKGTYIKLIPIISSVRSFQLICKRWQQRYDRLPDAVIVEGPMAGGHLGYHFEELAENRAPSLDQILTEVIAYANSFTPAIPVIAAGGIFDGADIARVLALGASGVQMATRFVCTKECDAHMNFKNAYLNATRNDITLIKSPVGLPGQVVNSPFVEKIKSGQTVPFRCPYKCLKSCNPETAPYCIARVLANAAEGKMDQAFAFAGSNAYRCNEIISVKTLMQRLADEYDKSISSQKTSSPSAITTPGSN